MVKLYLAAALYLGSCLAWSSALPRASAQEAASERDRARDLFDEGVALARSGRWADALSAFRRSAELVPRASTAYNVANAYYRIGRPVEGLAALDKYDAMPEVSADPKARDRGNALRELLESAIAEVRLAITPAAATVFVDGRLQEGTGFERAFRLNPGLHTLRIRHDGFETLSKEIRVDRGGRHAHTIALQPKTPVASPVIATPTPIAIPPDTGSDPAPMPKDDRKPFVKRPGFWVMIGAIAAVGVGAGVAVALVRKNDAPQCGTTGNCATTQGLTLTSF